MENVHKIKIKLENIWIDLIMGIYAPYIRRMVASPDLCLLPLRDTATGPPVAVKTPRITSAMGPWVRLSKGVKGMAGCLSSSRGVTYQKDWGVWEFGQGGTKEGRSLVVGSAENES